MTSLTHEQYLSLREKAELIEADHHGDKVLKLDNGSFLKLFRRKRLLSSSLYRPYAARFAQNAQALEARQIPCPQIIATYRIESIQRTAVRYWPLPGETLRQCLPRLDSETKLTLCRQLGAFIARLHREGVYFRSLHLGNIVLTDKDELGLIDIADMQCGSRPLSTNKRKRNFQHIFRYTQDAVLLQPQAAHFTSGYCDNLPGSQKTLFAQYLGEQLMASATTNQGADNRPENDR